jgi:prolyl-tRNA synthetase
MKSWIENAAVLLDSSVDENQINQFASSIEAHLVSTSKGFLLGDNATAADIIVSVLLADAATRAASTELPPNTKGLLLNILNNPALVKVLGAPKLASSTPNSASTDDFSDNAIVQKLAALSISHNTYSHTLSVTADDLLKNVPLPAGETHTKNVLFKDKKHGMFLVSVRPDSDVNTKTLAKDLKLEGKSNLRLADEETLMATLGVAKGCVGPLSIMNNTAKDVTLVLDERLFANDIQKIHSHPLRNDASTVITPHDLKRFLESVGVEPVIIPFATKEESSGKAPASRPDESKEPKGTKKSASNEKAQANNKKSAKKGETLLALQWKKDENFPMWYSDVIVLSEMIAYYDISGCYILRPWSYKIWELIQNWFNVEIEALGVENSYFPLFVSQDRLEREKDHVEGFAPEVAWVTKSGEGTLAKPIAIRPTSETIMYPAFSDWIKSHRDLPLKLNQWSNVVRWEFKYPTPFLRSREFLWQEGHTAHATYDDSQVMVMQALELYRKVYEELLAVPVVPGYKTEKEKFAGGHQTTTVEAYIAGSGRAIQGATSHNLGQNFGKMFDITFQDENGKSQVAWQTSWGLTTRSIGVMIMVHGDDTGLVLPPRIAPLQVIIVPIISKHLTDADARPYCESILSELKSAGIRVKYDDRTIYNPGWKYNHWEQKGVPIRIEVGPRDIEKRQVRVVTRFDGSKEDLSVDGIGATLAEKLESIQNAMFVKAKAARDEHFVKITDWKDFVPNLELNNLVLTPWCGGEHKDWEEWVKDKSREESLKARGLDEEDNRTSTSVAAKTLCIPFNQPELPEGTKCIASGLPATCWVLWGRSY